jgi:hypothetical protein
MFHKLALIRLQIQMNIFSEANRQTGDCKRENGVRDLASQLSTIG